MESSNQPFDVELFKKHLTETIIWCNHQLADHPEQGVSRLWSLVLLSDKGYQYEDSVFHMNDEDLIQFSNALFALRAQQVAQLLPFPPIRIDPNLMGGRLIMFWIRDTLFDGAAELASGGFFDWANIPAYDTWVYLHFYSNSAYILSWVPPEYKNQANEGISVIPEECVQWVNDWMRSEAHQRRGPHTPIYQMLQAAGLI